MLCPIAANHNHWRQQGKGCDGGTGTEAEDPTHTTTVLLVMRDRQEPCLERERERAVQGPGGPTEHCSSSGQSLSKGSLVLEAHSYKASDCHGDIQGKETT